MTGLDPDVRFDKLKTGIQANRYMQDYGLRLLPEIYELYSPLVYERARSLEVELGIDPREGGFGVWQAWCLSEIERMVSTRLQSLTDL